MKYDDKWFEVWHSDGAEVLPGYLLIVTPDQASKDILIIDPSKGNEIVFRSGTYDEATSWLWEDEFDLVEGRVFPDDGY